VIVGAGLAAWSAASTLRTEGFDGRIVLVGAEEHLPYDRPPLSKEYLRGEVDRDKVFLGGDVWYAENEIETWLASRVQTIVPAGRRVQLTDGRELCYDKVLVATGGRPRALDVPGRHLDGVFYLRSLEDADAIRHAFEQGTRLGIVGGGFIGAEVAAAARRKGLEVTLVEALSEPLANALGSEMGHICGSIHRDEGVEVRTNEIVVALEGRDRVTAILTSTGAFIRCDVVVVGVGIVPNVEVLERSGVDVRGGVVVDELCQTAVEGVYAAGDVARHRHPLFGEIRVEHWQNALNQGAAAARSMLGIAEPYADVHWFWSDQYDHNLQYAGFATNWEEVVVRGSIVDRDFISFYLKGGKVKAVFAVNRGRDVRRAMRVIEADVPVEARELRDEDVDLRTLAPTD
jgi:3-phenylpropionate/trans-cinnamate dioxygenase ferredoxin reductase subunit